MTLVFQQIEVFLHAQEVFIKPADILALKALEAARQSAVFTEQTFLLLLVVVGDLTVASYAAATLCTHRADS